MRRSLGVALAIMLLASRPASATFHLMQIEQVIGSVDGNTSVQAVQLRMRQGLQNLVNQGRLVVRDSEGLSPILLLNITTDVAISTAGARVLVASANFSTFTNPALTPDLVMANTIPASYLTAGSLTFEDDFGTVYWRLSWGGSNYTGTGAGSILNDTDADFSPPFPGVLLSGSGRALQYVGVALAQSTNNAAQYAMTAGAATFIRNSGASAQIKSTVDVGNEFAGLGVEFGLPIPNPARNSVSYSVTLPRQAHVKVRAFDLRGRAVRTLVDRDMPAGRQSLTWDITSEAPSLSSGVYLLVLEVDGRRLVRRFAYLRGSAPVEHLE